MPTDPPSRPTRARSAARWGIVALGVLLIAGVAAARLGEVVAEGALLGFFGQYEVARVRLLGIELYVDRSSSLSDAVSVCALAAITMILAAGARAVPDDPALRRTFTTAALGSAFLAADDLLAVHETVGHNLGALAALPGVDHPDDLIVGFYGLVVCVFAWRHRDLLAGRALRAWLVAVVCGGAAVLHDLSSLDLGRVEEGLEVVAAGAMVTAVSLVVSGPVAAARAARDGGLGGRAVA